MTTARFTNNGVGLLRDLIQVLANPAESDVHTVIKQQSHVGADPNKPGHLIITRPDGSQEFVPP